MTLERFMREREREREIKLGYLKGVGLVREILKDTKMCCFYVFGCQESARTKMKKKLKKINNFTIFFIKSIILFYF